MPIWQKRAAKGSRVWRQERHQHLPFKICAEGTKTASRNDHYLDLRGAKGLLERAGVAETTDATGGHCTASACLAESYRSESKSAARVPANGASSRFDRPGASPCYKS